MCACVCVCALNVVVCCIPQIYLGHFVVRLSSLHVLDLVGWLCYVSEPRFERGFLRGSA